jgi:hypothetical protein
MQRENQTLIDSEMVIQSGTLYGVEVLDIHEVWREIVKVRGRFYKKTLETAGNGASRMGVGRNSSRRKVNISTN